MDLERASCLFVRGREDMGAGFALGDLGAIFGLCFAAGFDIFD